MNTNEKKCVNVLEDMAELIRNGEVVITSVEIEHDIEHLAKPGTTIMSPEYTGHHILTVRWIDKK